MIGRVEFGAGGGALRLATLVVRSGEESLEAGPSFLLCSETFPEFAVINEETGLINELEGNADYLGFDLLVNIVRGAKDSVVFLKIRRGDVGVGCLQVIQDGTGGGEAVSNALVLEGANEHFVNIREKNFSERLVGAIILVEECRGGVESIAKFGDLGASGVGRDDGFRARVDRHDEGDG